MILILQVLSRVQSNQSLGGYEVFWLWLQLLLKHLLAYVNITSALLDSGLLSHYSVLIGSNLLSCDEERLDSCHEVIQQIFHYD